MIRLIITQEINILLLLLVLRMWVNVWTSNNRSACSSLRTINSRNKERHLNGIEVIPDWWDNWMVLVKPILKFVNLKWEHTKTLLLCLVCHFLNKAGFANPNYEKCRQHCHCFFEKSGWLSVNLYYYVILLYTILVILRKETKNNKENVLL